MSMITRQLGRSRNAMATSLGEARRMHQCPLLQPVSVGRVSVPTGRRGHSSRAAVRTQELSVAQQEMGLDFYEILGLHANAETAAIKRAYYDLIRQIHPDIAQDVESTELCVLLNEIYETLTDPEKRVCYDTIAGFSESSVNPFYDNSYEKDQVFVDEITCIGCGKCARLCPKSFHIEGSVYGRARVVKQGVYSAEEIEIAIESCPVNCISHVSIPQLSLLETALASVKRIDVFIMMRHGTSGEDVFELVALVSSIRSYLHRTGLIWCTNVAQRAWQRRHDKYQRHRDTSKSASIFGWTFGPATDSSEAAGGPRGDILDPASQRIAKLAASAARAMRLWRSRTDDRAPIASLTE